MKDLLNDWDKAVPGRIDNMLRALQHVVPSHLMDQRFGLKRTYGVADENGDTAFDEEELRPRPHCPACRWCRSVEESLTQLHALTA